MSLNTIISDTTKLLYVNSVDELDYNFLPIYKKCDNGKYFQICNTTLNDDLLSEKADITDLVLAIDGFATPVFNALSKMMNIKFVEDKEEKILVNKKWQKINYLKSIL